MIYLYEFRYMTRPRDGTLISAWSQTNYERSLTTDLAPAVTFVPQAGIIHSDISYDSEKAAGQLTVTVPRDHPVAVLFIGGYPEGTIELRVIELTSDAVDAISRVIWLGHIRDSNASELTAELTGSDKREQMERLGLRLNGGPTCQWPLYGNKCGLDEATNTRTGTVTSVSTDGRTVTTTLSEVDDFFKAGKLRANGKVRMATKSVGGVITLMNGMGGLSPGDAVSACKGCDRTEANCIARGNVLRFSAFAGFETPKNPFTKGVL
jgi:hypothetical protein